MLSLFGWLYGKIADVRNTLYDRGVFKSHSLGAKTISIGNITVGGTGKTPLVAFVAEILSEKGETVCILTRGYGRRNPKKRVLVSDGKTVLADAAQGGDEPVELGKKLLGKAIVVADADRVSAANWAKEKFGVTAFVLDDGFQHRRAKRHLDIVCVDATNPFGSGKILPAGILREPLENLSRADVVVITRANLLENIGDLKSQISKLNADARIFTCGMKLSNIIQIEEFHANTRSAQSEEKRSASLAFCALGNPRNFFEHLRQNDFNIVAQNSFPDHHFYTQKDIAALETAAKESNAKALLTSAKDAVKLKGLKFTMPCFVVEIALEFDNEKGFRDLIYAS